MKREICCPKCADEWRRTMNWDRGRGTPGKFPGFNENGEGMRQVTGKADVVCMCDECGKDIEVGEQAVAVSIYSKSTPYFEWECEYVSAVEPALDAEKGGERWRRVPNRKSRRRLDVLVGKRRDQVHGPKGSRRAPGLADV